jgi:hypothetical protein
MMETVNNKGYNERLFSGKWRSKIHFSRFYWLGRQIRELKLAHLRIIELGCFDAKTVEYLSHEPQKYLGLDANWEGGLDQARAAYKHSSFIELLYCQNADCIPIPSEPYNVGVCMETLEHVAPALLDPYLTKLSLVVNGYVFFTVPVELGLMFLMKHGFKRLLGMSDHPFDRINRKEFLNCVLGRLDKVKRDEHKGFDYRIFIDQVAKHFDVARVSGVFPGLPFPSLNLTIGIVARTKALS